jgi:hypothetical protein
VKVSDNRLQLKAIAPIKAGDEVKNKYINTIVASGFLSTHLKRDIAKTIWLRFARQ